MTSVFSSSVNEMPWLIRGDFSDQVVWDEVARAVGVGRTESDDDAQVDFVVINDAEFEAVTPTRLLELEPYEHGTFFCGRSYDDHPLRAPATGD